MQGINDVVEKWVGREVYVEGQFPLPTGAPGGVAYSPCIGKLTAVYSDGYAILEKGNKDATVLFRANLRSINLVPEVSGLVLPPERRGLTG
jgi:hypothetical protein